MEPGYEFLFTAPARSNAPSLVLLESPSPHNDTAAILIKRMGISISAGWLICERLPAVVGTRLSDADRNQLHSELVAAGARVALVPEGNKLDHQKALAVVTETKCPPRLLEILAGLRPDLKPILAANPNTPIGVLARLATSNPKQVLENPTLELELIADPALTLFTEEALVALISVPGASAKLLNVALARPRIYFNHRMPRNVPYGRMRAMLEEIAEGKDGGRLTEIENLWRALTHLDLMTDAFSTEGISVLRRANHTPEIEQLQARLEAIHASRKP